MGKLAKIAVVACLALALLTTGCGGGKKGNGYFRPPAQTIAVIR